MLRLLASGDLTEISKAHLGFSSQLRSIRPRPSPEIGYLDFIRKSGDNFAEFVLPGEVAAIREIDAREANIQERLNVISHGGRKALKLRLKAEALEDVTKIDRVGEELDRFDERASLTRPLLKRHLEKCGPDRFRIVQAITARIADYFRELAEMHAEVECDQLAEWGVCRRLDGDPVSYAPAYWCEHFVVASDNAGIHTPGLVEAIMACHPEIKVSTPSICE
jgi:hypothetical protein